MIAGYIASALIGLSLGLVGGGGSILTVPVLVYLFHTDATIATYYSLFVVGTTSLAGAWNNYRLGNVQLKVAGLFGITSIVTVLAVRKYLLPLIPATIGTVGTTTITRSFATMLLFAILMIMAAISMIKGRREAQQQNGNNGAVAIRMVASGIGIGVVTGVLGAGGGFLLIPVLVLLLHLPMKQAVGTSLLIIAMNSLIGFAGDIGKIATDWALLTKITLIAVAGIVAGTYLSKNIQGEKLKKGFGWFVLIMGIYIAIREIYFALQA